MQWRIQDCVDVGRGGLKKSEIIGRLGVGERCKARPSPWIRYCVRASDDRKSGVAAPSGSWTVWWC